MARAWRAASALASVTLVSAVASAQTGDFDYTRFERDPTTYAAAHYPYDAAPRELSADLRAIGFTCREAYAQEAGAEAVCERIQQTSQHCFHNVRVTIRVDSVNIERLPRCMGVLR